MSNKNYFGESPKKSYSEEIANSTIKICEYLSINTESLNSQEVFAQLEEHINRYGKLFYSIISRYVFDLYKTNENRLGNMQTNIDILLNIPIDDKELKKTIKKIWDHVNLASCQATMLQLSDLELNKGFEDKFRQKSPEILKELDKRIDSTNAQLISLIAIFTALSFIVFGGLESLSGIMGNITQNVMVSKLIAIASIWGIFMFNIIALFMFFVIKIINRTSTSLRKNKKGFISQFPVISVGNYVLVFVFLLSSVHYICSNEIELFGFLSYKCLPWVALVIMAVLTFICFTKPNKIKRYRRKKHLRFVVSKKSSKQTENEATKSEETNKNVPSD